MSAQEMVIPTSVAQAIEIVVHLIGGSFINWFNKNDPKGCYDKAELEYLTKRLDAFSKTLSSMRITKITPSSRPIQFSEPWSDSGEMLRSISFELGDENKKNQVIIDVLFDGDFRSEGGPLFDKWGVWTLNHWKAIVCLKHPDHRLVNYLVFGGSALPSSGD